jgi:hypothetical protein
MLRLEVAGHGANFGFQGVFEMTARAKDLHALEAGFGKLAEKFRSQFARDEEVSGK